MALYTNSSALAQLGNNSPSYRPHTQARNQQKLNHQDRPRRRFTRSPGRHQMSPPPHASYRRRDISPRRFPRPRRLISSFLGPASPPRAVSRGRAESPMKREVSRIKQELSPMRRAVSPVRREMSPKRRDVSPVRRGTSPRRRDMSPVRRGMSPRRRDLSPMRRDVSPGPGRRKRRISLSRKSPILARVETRETERRRRRLSSSSGSAPRRRKSSSVSVET